MRAVHDRGGRLITDKAVQRQVGNILKKHAGALAEKTLAKALTGDATAMLACAELLRMSMQPPPTIPTKPEEK